MLLGMPDCSATTSSDTLIGYRRERRRDTESRMGANVGAAMRPPPQYRSNSSSGWYQRCKRRESEGIISEMATRIAREDGFLNRLVRRCFLRTVSIHATF